MSNIEEKNVLLRRRQVSIAVCVVVAILTVGLTSKRDDAQSRRQIVAEDEQQRLIGLLTSD